MCSNSTPDCAADGQEQLSMKHWETRASTRRKIKFPKDFFLSEGVSYYLVFQEPKIAHKLFCSPTECYKLLEKRADSFREWPEWWTDFAAKYVQEKRQEKKKKRVYFLPLRMCFQFKIILQPGIRCNIMPERCAWNIILKNIFTDFLSRNVCYLTAYQQNCTLLKA